MRHDRAGFTLLELMAALSLAGFAMIGSILLLDQLTDSAGRIASEAARVAREGNGERMLMRIFLDAAQSTDSAEALRGDQHSVEVSTSCDVPGGWTEPCRVTLTIDERGDSSVVLAQVGGGASYALRRQAGMAEFRYYDASPVTDTVWVTQWRSDVTLPAAIALITGTDTTVYPTGPSRE